MNIGSEWIKARLTGRRGEKAALARALHIGEAEVSKILSGTRRVQPEEIAGVLAFFGEPMISDEEREDLALLRSAPAALREAARAFLRAAAQEAAGTPGAARQTADEGK